MYSMQPSMRKYMLTAVVICVFAIAEVYAQPTTTPRVSPHAIAVQRVGLSDVTIDYHRPSVADREIWGALVPWGEQPFPWRAGANDNTTINFTHDVKIDGKPLPAGTYGLHMVPNEKEWTIIFSNNSTSWGSFSYDKAEDALRVPAKVHAAPFKEQLVYGFDNVSDVSADVYLHWEKVMVGFTVEFGTPEIVMASLRDELRHSAGWTWWGWQQAAQYAINKNIEQEQALTWIDRSIQITPNFNNLSTKALLLTRMGKETEAAELEKKALALGNEFQLNNFGYAAIAAGDIEKAIKVFKMNIERNPESWNTYDSLAEAYAKKGEKAKAVELYNKALSMAPEAQHPRINGALKQLKEAKS